MITLRTTHREAVFRWVNEIARLAHSEKAEFTLERIHTLSEPIFSMLAASSAADPQEMAVLVARADFPDRAERYLSKNAFLNIGIFAPKSSSGREAFVARSRAVAQDALAIFVREMPIVESLSGAHISNLIDALAEAHFCTPAGFAAGHGHATPILLREVLGLPGDAEVCEREDRPEVLINAGRALRALGVELAPAITEKLDDAEGAPRP